MSADILIIGGGPAGTSAALALAQQGRCAVVLESSRYDGVKVGETLPPEAQEPLTALGVWERFLRAEHRPSLCNLSAWGGPRLESREHLWSPYGQGWHLDRARFDAMLCAAVRDTGSTVLEAARLETVARVDDRWQAEVLRGEERLQIRARWLIDATGRAASLVRRFGGKRVRSDRLIGMTAFLAPGPDAEALGPAVLVEAEETGWWYSAPLPDGRAVAAWMTDAGLPGAAAARDPAFWWRQLGETFHTRERLGRHGPPRSVLVRDAAPALTEMPPVPGFLAVGDAAASFDPLSGMGIVAALRGGIEAAATIGQALGGDADAITGYTEGIRRRFAEHLRLRQRDYDAEIRWPAAPFWRPRRSPEAVHDGLRLGPETLLLLRKDAEASWALDRLEARHPAFAWRRLCETCREPAPAVQVVETFLGRRAGDATEPLALLGLLVRHGVVTSDVREK